MGGSRPRSGAARMLEPAKTRSGPLSPSRGAGPGRRSPVEPNALVILGVLSAVWAWWAWRQGGYFVYLGPVVLLPGVIILCAVAILMALWAPLQARLSVSMPARVAFWALLGLGAWTLLSAVWSPAPDVAVRDAQRVLMYAVSFGLGIWLCNLVGQRMHLAWAPVAVAGGAVALATTVVLLVGGDLTTYLYGDGTLQYPLGYRNANGAFFAIGMWPLIGTAMTKGVPWLVRGLGAGGGSLCFSLALLSQSRGSQLGGIVAAVVFVISSRERLPAVGWLAVVIAPSALVLPYLSELYSPAGLHPGLLTSLHHAAAAALAAAALATTLGATVARLGWLSPSRGGVARQNRLVAGSLLATGAVAAVVFAIAVGNPLSWFDQKFAQFRQDPSSAAASSTRFGLNVGSPRGDLWRVALDDGLRNPLLGDGAGGFHYSYLRHRDAGGETVRDAHSVELETLSELGVPGLALLVAVLGGAGVAIVRSGRLGPSSAALSTVALAAGSYWLIHTSLDWFWPYPAVTAPVMGLLGAACAPMLRTTERVHRGPARRAIVVGSAALALSAVPIWLSDRYTDKAVHEWRSDTGLALRDLARARTLFPLSIDPLMTRGAIAREAGRRSVAIDAFSDVTRQRPEEWAAHYFLARLYAAADPRRARQELAEALELDPREPLLKDYERHLGSPN